MRKIWFFIGIVFILIGCTNCKLEKEITHNTAVPIVESLAKYAKVNGIPKSFKDIKDFPYELESCSKKSNLLECEVLKDGYFFIKDGEYYSLRLDYYPNKEAPSGFGIIVVYNTTSCVYNIYSHSMIEKNFSQPACSMIGRCAGWFRQ